MLGEIKRLGGKKKAKSMVFTQIQVNENTVVEEKNRSQANEEKRIS